MYSNTSLTSSILPRFSSMSVECIASDIQMALTNCYNTVDQIVSKNIVSWDALYYPLMIAENELKRVWSPIAHLNAVQHTAELRDFYQKNFCFISEYKNWMQQHDSLYRLYNLLYINDSYQQFNVKQKTVLKNILLNFKLSGVLLSLKQKRYYRYITLRLSQLYINYANNVFDATLGWNKLIKDKKKLSGIPDHMLEIAKSKAMECGEKGWLFTLQYPSYSAVITYCDVAELREEFYWAFSTRASDQGPNAGKWDNTGIMEEIISLRYESSKMLGYNSFLEKSLETKMIQHPEQVFNFFISLSERVCRNERQEFFEIRDFARKYNSCNSLQPWDILYFREKQKQHILGIKNEELSCYFPINIVLDGMFFIVNRIYNIFIKRRYNVDVWHPDVQFFDVFDEIGEWRGGFYLDVYLRKNKQEGAWMDDFVSLMYKNNTFYRQKPIVYLVCNFECTNDQNKLCLLTHNDVITLFHEFGHVLHHIMTLIDIPEISGINSVPQDVLELPSQFMEKFCWEPDILQLISAHFITKKSLSKCVITNLLRVKTYQTSSHLLRQMIYGLFDLKLHYEYCPEKSGKVLTIFNKIVQEMSIYPIVSWDRFPHAFIHIFSSDDYAAGYYSYLWSEMLASNVWLRFQESGVLNKKIGKLFLKNIFELDEPVDFLKCLVNFCGRQITIEPMLEYYGISIF